MANILLLRPVEFQIVDEFPGPTGDILQPISPPYLRFSTRGGGVSAACYQFSFIGVELCFVD